MIRSLPLHSSPTAFAVEPGEFRCRRSSSSGSASMIRCSLRNYDSIPKLNSFNRSDTLPELSFIERTEKELAGYCAKLEGDACYSCWEAYLELSELESEAPKREIESLINSSNDMQSLIGNIHRRAASHRERKQSNGSSTKPSVPVKNEEKKTEIEEIPRHIPDGIPRSQEEIDEEERAKMPDSRWTILLRAKGKFPAWYIPRPDHETD